MASLRHMPPVHTKHSADTARQDMQNTGLHPVASTIPEAVKMEFAAVTETDGGRRDEPPSNISVAINNC